jgi:hypothetical protein
MAKASQIIPNRYRKLPRAIPRMVPTPKMITDCAMKWSNMVSMRVPMDFINPMSLRRLTISSEILLETTVTPREMIKIRAAQMKVSKKTPSAEASPIDVRVDVTSSMTFENRNRNVVAPTIVVIDSNTTEVLKGRRFRSCEA